jgi:hypothetical protein
LRAGGNLHLQNSITDGFFQFGDQYDPQYLSSVLFPNQGAAFALAAPLTLSYTDPSSLSGPWASAEDEFNFCFIGSGCASNTMAFSFLGPSQQLSNIISYVSVGAAAASPIHIPYSASGNSAAALGSWSGGAGDALSSAVIFPLLPNNQPISSSSLNLVAGADVRSANPLRTSASSLANFILDGEHQQTFSVSSGGVTILPGLYLAVGTPSNTSYVSVDDWLAAMQTAFGGLDPNSTGVEIDSTIPILKTAIDQFAADHPDMVFADTADNFADFTLNGMVLFMKSYFPTVEAAFVQTLGVPPPGGSGSGSSKTIVMNPQTMVRTGTGEIHVAASGTVDLTNGPVVSQQVYFNGSPSGSAQAGGTAIYTAGHPVAAAQLQLPDPDTGQMITVNLSAALSSTSNLPDAASYDYGAAPSGTGAFTNGIVGVVVADPVYLEGGGNVSVTAGGNVLGRRDAALPGDINQQTNPLSWVGAVDEPWRTGAVGADTYAAINPQLFVEGVGTFGGGNIKINAGGNISDLSMIATDSMVTANATGGNVSTKAIVTFGGGNVNVAAGNDILGGRVDVASGAANISAVQNIASAGTFTVNIVGQTSTQIIQNLLRLRITDATVEIAAGNDLSMQGVASLGVLQTLSSLGSGAPQQLNNLNALGFYSAQAGVDMVSNGSIAIANANDNLLSRGVTNNVQNAIYPGTFEAAALTGDLTVVVASENGGGGASSVLLVPSSAGQLQLLAGGNIAPTSIAILDADPGILPGPFSAFNSDGSVVQSGLSWVFPAVFPSTPAAQLQEQHKKSPTHTGDPDPVRVDAGGSIGDASGGLILSVPKQARIYAGEDIINMMFFGQNLASSDITRVVAGRDITATTKITTPILGVVANHFVSGTPEPAVQGNTFVIGGPGTFMLEAGRDLGPFLNSASVTSLRGSNPPFQIANETYGGGILSVGNDWNPWLPAQGADINVMFGVAKGINYDSFRDRYLDPAGLASLPAYLVMPASGSGTESIYGPDLIAWLQQRAASALTAAYGTTDVSYAQAYAIFKNLPELQQRVFLNTVYFNELKQTSVKGGVSYLQYARGYQAVNTLFPASLGYTANDLSGGSNGANAPVETGNLDLRLATIQTEFGGDIDIFGPGGRVIAGSTVRTDAQAARRTFDGGRLFAGNDDVGNIVSPYPTAINAIPAGYEGVLTLRGGNINTFTDGDFLLNQSRLFTEGGGEITMWSSNADLNAGEGPKTSSNFPPVVVTIDQNLFVQTDKSGATTGAGIAALQATPDAPPADVFLIAPRGTVDAGAAGVRVSGDLSVAALHVANAANFQVQGTTAGIPTAPAVNIGALTTASNTAGAAAAAATDAAGKGSRGNAQQDLPSIITVEVIGYGGGDGTAGQDLRDEDRHKTGRHYDQNSSVQFLGLGKLSANEKKDLTETEKRNLKGQDQ